MYVCRFSGFTRILAEGEISKMVPRACENYPNKVTVRIVCTRSLSRGSLKGSGIKLKRGR